MYIAPLGDGVGSTTAAIGIVGVLLGAGKLDPQWIAPYFPFEEDDSPFQQDEEDPVVRLVQHVMHAEVSSLGEGRTRWGPQYPVPVNMELEA